jgi:hypothetical protein
MVDDIFFDANYTPQEEDAELPDELQPMITRSRSRESSTPVYGPKNELVSSIKRIPKGLCSRRCVFGSWENERSDEQIM